MQYHWMYTVRNMQIRGYDGVGREFNKDNYLVLMEL